MDTDKTNQLVFKLNNGKIIGGQLLFIVTGILGISVYFGLDPEANDFIKVICLLFGLAVLGSSAYYIIFIPTLIKIDNTTISFKRLFRSNPVKIPQVTISKIQFLWLKSGVLFRIPGSKRRPLYAIKIFTFEKGINKSYYLLMLIWYPKSSTEEIITKLKQTPLKDKIMETYTGYRFFFY